MCYRLLSGFLGGLPIPSKCWAPPLVMRALDRVPLLGKYLPTPSFKFKLVFAGAGEQAGGGSGSAVAAAAVQLPGASVPCAAAAAHAA